MRKKMDEHKRDGIKNKILDATRNIIERDGFDAVSIRKVAKLAGYTEGSIYNYFSDKDSIVTALVQQGFDKIIKATMEPIDEGLSVKEQIIQRFIKYTKAAISMPEYYKKMMLSNEPHILEITSIMNAKPNQNEKGIAVLANMIKKGVDTNEFASEDPTFVAKIIWTANFGLTLRLIVEKVSNENEIETLVKHQLVWLLEGLKR